MVLRALTWRVILESGISHNTRYAAGLDTDMPHGSTPEKFVYLVEHRGN